MKQEIEIVVPTRWSAITLKKYLQLKKDIEAYKDDDNAVWAVMFYHLCGVDAHTLKKIDVQTYTQMQRDLAGFMEKVEYPLQQFVTIDGKEYGFEPNLSQMPYGAYVDLGKYETSEIDHNWAQAMSILYRPVKRKIGASYEIEGYNGLGDWEKFLNVDMEVHFGAIGFFTNLLQDCQKSILKYLKEAEIPTNILTILERNGEHTPLYGLWQVEISHALMRSLDYH